MTAFADPPPDLLQYGVSTLPAPLQISPASAASPGMINLWASAPSGTTVYCSKIQIAVPLGDGERELCPNRPSVTPNTTWWTVSSAVVVDGGELGLAPQIRYELYTAICTSDRHWLIDYDLQFSIVSREISRVEGRAGIVVAETSGTDRSNMELRRTVYDVLKGPVTDYLNGLVTTLAPPASTALPVAEVTAGQAFRLAWSSNAPAFAVYAGAATTPVWTGVDNELVFDRGVTSETTLTVVAQGARGGVLMATATIGVSNPVLTPASLTAKRLSAAGTAQLAAATLASLTTGTLDVPGGLARLSGGARASTLTATGGATLRGAVGTGAANVTGLLGVRGDARLGDASATVLAVGSALSMFNPRTIAPAQYTPSTDGFIIGTVGPVNPGPDSTGVAYGYTAPFGNAYAYGGNELGWRDSKNTWMAPCAGSFLMPVRRGNAFALWTQVVWGSAPPFAFIWVPFGTSAQLTKLTAEEAAACGLPSPETQDTASTAALEGPPVRTEVGDLVGAFADLLGDRLTSEHRDRLRRAVGTLTVPHMTPKES